MQAWLIRVLMWSLQRLGWEMPVVETVRTVDCWGLPETIRPMVAVAHAFCVTCDASAPENASGEWKRHQVYAKLLKAYPDAAHRDLGLALELAVSHKHASRATMTP